jgi:ABC-type lipoprotein export system ATPase subunit
MSTATELLGKKIGALLVEYPFISGFLNDYGLRPDVNDQLIGHFFDSLTEDFMEDIGIDKGQLINNLIGLIEAFEASGKPDEFKIDSITIIGGVDKTGLPENIQLRLVAGTITSIVGATGSGKSRLLADIEWMAQGDTPTGRKILVNDIVPNSDLRFSLEHKLVAQLSQNMNFVMDASVGEFITMHADSRMVKNADRVVADIVFQANLLAGESFIAETPITALSGGQSRALMIADTAFLSLSPIVLIDEIENAGIDRKKALQLLIKKEKIVLMATHDPILALMASQRLVIKNGGIQNVIQTSEREKLNLSVLEDMDSKMLALRNKLRNGEMINEI